MHFSGIHCDFPVLRRTRKVSKVSNGTRVAIKVFRVLSFHRDGKNYVYRVLDWKKDKVEAVFYFSLVLSSTIVFYLIGNLIHKAKHSLYSHFTPVDKVDKRQEL
jgi:hypothetical protein